MPLVNTLPYPTSTDIPDVPEDIRKLAVAVDARVPVAYSAGLASIAAAACGASGSLSVAVTFPVGRFTQAPVVSATIAAVISNSVPMIPRTSPSTAAGVTLYVFNNSAGSITPSAAIPVSWHAVQMLAGSGPGLLAAGDTFTATCHTTGCENEGAVLELALDVDAPPDAVACGVCGRPITDTVGL